MNDVNLKEVSSNLFDLLLLLNKRIFNHSDFCRGLHIPPSHVKVIFYLSHNGAQPVSQIAQNLNISKPNMTPIIDKLINDGFVNRYEDPNDRRVLRVELTEKSTELFNSHMQVFKDLLCTKMSDLSDDDLNTLHTSVDSISDIILKLK